MSKYTVTKVSTSLNEINSEISGIPLHRIKTVTREYKEKLGKSGGMRLVKTHDLMDKLPEIVNSSLDMRIVSYILKHNSLHGVVKYKSSTRAIGINDLANEFGTTRKKVSEVIKRCIDCELVKKNKRELVLNPYIISPFNANNDTLYALQTYWDSNFTYNITDELALARERYLQTQAINTPSENI